MTRMPISIRIDLASAFLFMLLICTASVVHAEEEKRFIRIYWDDSIFLTKDHAWFGYSPRTRRDAAFYQRPHFDCAGLRAFCVDWEIDEDTFEVREPVERTLQLKAYNIRLLDARFRYPFAIILRADTFDFEARTLSIVHEDGFEEEFTDGVIAPYETDLPTHEQRHAMLDLHVQFHMHGPRVGYFKIGEAVRGKEALQFWQELLGLHPQRECDEFNCGIVVAASKSGDPAIAYCAVKNTRLGIGFPFECITVAFQKDADWYVLSEDAPYDWEGHGLGMDIFCEKNTTLTLPGIASNLIDVFRDERTNIGLQVSREADGLIVLAGKKTAGDSKFFKGYYEKVYALFNIYMSKDSDAEFIERDENVVEYEKSVMVVGVYNLLISAEPSPHGRDYRDVGTTSLNEDVVWVQNQIKRIMSLAVGDCGVTEM